MGTQKANNLITTYMERSLHAALKKHFCPNEDMHEVKIGGFVADACADGTIFEIQTGNLAPLAKKLRFYLENTDLNVVVVRPIAQNRRIFWLDESSGEFSTKAPRLSSKHEGLPTGISDIYYLRDIFGHERLTFCFVLMEINEVRLLNGYGKHKKIRASSLDRLAGEIFSMHYISSVSDIADIILPALPDRPFSRDELSSALHLKGLKLWSAQKLLVEVGILDCKKEGKRLIFDKRFSH